MVRSRPIKANLEAIAYNRPLDKSYAYRPRTNSDYRLCRIIIEVHKIGLGLFKIQTLLWAWFSFTHIQLRTRAFIYSLGQLPFFNIRARFQQSQISQRMVM